MFRDSLDPADDISYMRTENAFVYMDLIKNDPFQVCKETAPCSVIRQDPQMQHIRIGQDHLGTGADQGTLYFRCVAVINRDFI